MTEHIKINEPDLRSLLERGRLAFYQFVVGKIEAAANGVSPISHQELTLMHKLLQEAGMTYVPDEGKKHQDIVNKTAADLPEFEDEEE